MLPLALILLLTPAQAWGSPSAEEFAVAVSYTHLTLPTILIV